MSVLDRVKRAPVKTVTNVNGGQTSEDQSSTQEASQIAGRIKLVADELIAYAAGKEDNPFASHMWFIKSIFSVFFDEMTGQDDEKIAIWLQQFGVLLEWCGTGDDSVLPPEVREYIRTNHPDRLAITAGSD